MRGDRVVPINNVLCSQQPRNSAVGLFRGGGEATTVQWASRLLARFSREGRRRRRVPHAGRESPWGPVWTRGRRPKRIATLARSGQQACAGTCALRHHSRHNSAPALPPPSDDVRWGQSTPASSLIAREARPLAAASDLRRRLDRRWPRWRPT